VHAFACAGRLEGEAARSPEPACEKRKVHAFACAALREAEGRAFASAGVCQRRLSIRMLPSGQIKPQEYVTKQSKSTA
jgi:hypothetical protein